MDETTGNIILIIIIIAIVAIGFLVSYFIRMGANKAEDAIRNAKKRSDMQKNPPQQENLADRYKDNK